MESEALPLALRLQEVYLAAPYTVLRTLPLVSHAFKELTDKLRGDKSFWLQYYVSQPLGRAITIPQDFTVTEIEFVYSVEVTAENPELWCVRFTDIPLLRIAPLVRSYLALRTEAKKNTEEEVTLLLGYIVQAAVMQHHETLYTDRLINTYLRNVQTNLQEITVAILRSANVEVYKCCCKRYRPNRFGPQTNAGLILSYGLLDHYEKFAAIDPMLSRYCRPHKIVATIMTEAHAVQYTPYIMRLPLPGPQTVSYYSSKFRHEAILPFLQTPNNATKERKIELLKSWGILDSPRAAYRIAQKMMEASIYSSLADKSIIASIIINILTLSPPLPLDTDNDKMLYDSVREAATICRIPEIVAMLP